MLGFSTTPVLSSLMFMEFLERIHVVGVNGWLKLKGIKVTTELRVSEPDVVSEPTQTETNVLDSKELMITLL